MPGRQLRFVKAHDVMDVVTGVEPIVLRCQHRFDELEGISDRQLLADASDGCRLKVEVEGADALEVMQRYLVLEEVWKPAEEVGFEAIQFPPKSE